MLKNLLLFFIAATFFIGCTQDTDPTNPQAEADVFSVSVTADPANLPDNNPDVFSTITATLTDVNGAPVHEGTLVSFISTRGSIESSARTDEHGEATVRLEPGIGAGMIEVTASVDSPGGPLKGRARVCVVNPSIPVSIELSAAPLMIQVRGTGGIETSVITASIRNGIGELIDMDVGVNAEFELINEPDPPVGCTINGNGQSDDAVVVDGVAIVGVNAGTQIGGKLVRVTATWQQNESISAMITIAVVSGPPFQVDLDVNDLGVDKGGGLWEIEVSARVWDLHRNPVADNIPVVFTVEPEIATITPGFTGNLSQNGVSTPGAAFGKLIYQSVNSFDPIEISAEIQTAQGQITGEREHILPLQRGYIELHVDPGNWMFSDDNALAEIHCWVVLKDGHDILINNAPILFSSNRGQFWWRDFSRDRLVEFFPDPVRKHTGVVDREHNEEPGQATVYLRAEEVDIYLDPFTLEVDVQIVAEVEGYGYVTAEPQLIFFTRSAN